jgi:Secretion system C-terminal sorting domain
LGIGQNLNLAPNTSITLDFDTIFPNNQLTNLCVWSSLPNNHVDAMPVNDYFCKNVLITANRELDPSALQLFPNPVSNTLFYTNATDFQNIKLLIYNSLRQLIKIEDIANQVTSSIDVQVLPQGSYYYTLTQEGAMLKRDNFIKIED